MTATRRGASLPPAVSLPLHGLASRERPCARALERGRSREPGATSGVVAPLAPRPKSSQPSRKGASREPGARQRARRRYCLPLGVPRCLHLLRARLAGRTRGSRLAVFLLHIRAIRQRGLPGAHVPTRAELSSETAQIGLHFFYDWAIAPLGHSRDLAIARNAGAVAIRCPFLKTTPTTRGGEDGVHDVLSGQAQWMPRQWQQQVEVLEVGVLEVEVGVEALAGTRL